LHFSVPIFGTRAPVGLQVVTLSNLLGCSANALQDIVDIIKSLHVENSETVIGRVHLSVCAFNHAAIEKADCESIHTKIARWAIELALECEKRRNWKNDGCAGEAKAKRGKSPWPLVPVQTNRVVASDEATTIRACSQSSPASLSDYVKQIIERF
jgi:hypothetical protein